MEVLLFLFSLTIDHGLATWYGAGNYHGDVRADGETFDPSEIGCAHRSIPLGTPVIVSAGDRSIVCPINDRGPYAVDGPDGFCNNAREDCDGEYRAVLDLSRGAAKELWDVDSARDIPNGKVTLIWRR